MRPLLPNLRAALSWIDTRSRDGTEFVTYQRKSARGLDNQGWKALHLARVSRGAPM